MSERMTGTRRRAIFMDRDGTVLDEVGYVNHVDRARLLPRSAAAVRKANDAGFQVVVVTNQAGVARGYFPESLVTDVNDLLRVLLAEHGARVDGIYYCPHHPTVGPAPYQKDCDCRKPRPGMLQRAADEMGIDLATSYIVGDTIKDVEAGQRVGAVSILLRTGYGKGELELHSHGWKHHPQHIADDLLDAVDWILAREDGAAAGSSSDAGRAQSGRAGEPPSSKGAPHHTTSAGAATDLLGGFAE